jgi:hypothetical protein
VGPFHDRGNPSSTQGHRRRRGRRARRCLLKGCERWFVPTRPQARYCGATCRAAAARWRQWKAQQRYRQTARGRACRGAQSRRRRQRQRERPRERAGSPSCVRAWVIAQRQIFLHLRSAWLLCDVRAAPAFSPPAILWNGLSACVGTRARARAPLAPPLAGAPASPRARPAAESGAYCATRRQHVAST